MLDWELMLAGEKSSMYGATEYVSVSLVTPHKEAQSINPDTGNSLRLCQAQRVLNGC